MGINREKNISHFGGSNIFSPTVYYHVLLATLIQSLAYPDQFNVQQVQYGHYTIDCMIIGENMIIHFFYLV